MMLKNWILEPLKDAITYLVYHKNHTIDGALLARLPFCDAKKSRQAIKL